MENKRPPLRRSSCIYHLDDVDIAVYFEIMEEWYPSYKSLFTKAFKTFKTVERELEGDTGPETAGKPQSREDYIQMRTANLPEGWWFTESKEHLLISHADKKYTEKCGKFADAIRKEIAESFKNKNTKKDKSQKEDFLVPIIRVCQSVGEYNAFVDTSTGIQAWNPETKEVVVWDGTREGYEIEWTYSNIGAGIFFQFFNEEFQRALPDPWYTSGMSYYFSQFKLKGSSCKYIHDASVAEQLRDAERKGECKPIKRLLTPGSNPIQSIGDYWKVGNLICFLNSREGNKKPWKGVLDQYLENFRVAYDDLMAEMKEDLAEEEKPQSEEEAKKKGDSYIERFKDIGKKVRERTFQETFASWTDSDWDKLENAFQKWAL